MLEDSEDESVDANAETSSYIKARLYHAMQDDEHPAISNELESHLLHLYFTWEQPWCQVVNEKLFRQSRATNGKFSSPLLLNSILAVASRYSDRLEVRSDPDDPNTAGRIFLEKAEVLLHFELKWPSLSTIQSISILGTYYVVNIIPISL